MAIDQNAVVKVQRASFFNSLAALYRVANASDSDGEARQAWTKGAMAGEAFCRPVDSALREMVKAGVITAEESQEFYDSL
jgi:hypothetical protein